MGNIFYSRVISNVLLFLHGLFFMWISAGNVVLQILAVAIITVSAFLAARYSIINFGVASDE